MNSRCSSI